MSVVIPTATYACETWTKTASITNKLDVFHRRCLRSILKISWRDHITNEEEKENDRTWTQTAKRETGKCVNRGRPKKTWRQTAKEDLSEMGVSWYGARRVAKKGSEQMEGDSSPNDPRGTGGTKSE
ncbi:hypothetical protein Bbelb_276070 [Xyrichtys novacula]|uniref:Uncharacterized protein n=1 Tax=Xyrichtys novacula TaxID=13765 RepID=A0AAV1EMW5_XYRNO|nr:hypothetical protein Bbelb_276070 [Xyrichtys novacula]